MTADNLKIPDRLLWECPHCGNANDDRYFARWVRYQCGNCGLWFAEDDMRDADYGWPDEIEEADDHDDR